MEPKTTDRHLADAELFNLAVPPVGEPEALPRHLSECWSCSRALQEWKSAVRELAEEETEELDRRSPAEWEALEEKTIEAMKRAGRTRPAAAARWAVLIAACLLLAVFLTPSSQGGAGGREAIGRDPRDALGTGPERRPAAARRGAALAGG